MSTPACNATNSGKTNVDKIKIAMSHRGAGVAPVFAALEGGYTRAGLLEPELVPYHGHGQQFAEGADCGRGAFYHPRVGGGGELLLANTCHQGDAVVLASAISRSAQQAAARPGNNNRDDLRGKRWGVSTRNDADECAIIMAFDRWGWTIDDIEIALSSAMTARGWIPLAGPEPLMSPSCMRRNLPGA